MEDRAKIIGISFVAGLTIGILVGSVTDNMGLWIAMGTVIGLIVGAVISTVLTSREDEE
jgi:F0F1-type ATP synthase assembly protein I